jgi:hypothetical protein
MKPETQHKSSSRLMGDDPLDGEAILERFYRPRSHPRSAGEEAPPSNDVSQRVAAGATKEKPTHYKVVCISLYNEDIERLEGLVAELKRRGHTKANKSQLIRAALAQVDLAKIPKGF